MFLRRRAVIVVNNGMMLLLLLSSSCNYNNIFPWTMTTASAFVLSSLSLSSSSKISSFSSLVRFAKKNKKKNPNKKHNNNNNKTTNARTSSRGGFAPTAAAATTTTTKPEVRKNRKESSSPSAAAATTSTINPRPNNQRNFGTLPSREQPRSAATAARLNTRAAQLTQSKQQMEEFRCEQQQQQELGANDARPRQLVQVSANPLVFTIDEFIDPDLCRRVRSDAAGCFDLMFPEALADRVFHGQESEMDGLLFRNCASSDYDNHDHYDSDSAVCYPDGLHMDTNNQCLFRHVTCILYLNDVPAECGGATVFPLARALDDDPALAASRRLLDHGLSHTKSSELMDLGLSDDARLLESRVNDDFATNPREHTAVRIQPRAGRLLVFFSRDSHGREDPRAWHAGERILPSNNNNKDGITEKRILTLFKEVDLVAPQQQQIQEATLESCLAPQIKEQRSWLQAKAKLQRALLTTMQ